MAEGKNTLKARRMRALEPRNAAAHAEAVRTGCARHLRVSDEAWQLWKAVAAMYGLEWSDWARFTLIRAARAALREEGARAFDRHGRDVSNAGQDVIDTIATTTTEEDWTP